MNTIHIAIGCDHAGFSTKEVLVGFLNKLGYTVKDFGTYSADSVDYPDFAHPVAEAVGSGLCNFGFVICGSGNGVNITANKHKGVRSALCWMPEIASLARLHNDANVCAIPARYTSFDEAKEIAQAFLNANFEGDRHTRRVDKIEG